MILLVAGCLGLVFVGLGSWLLGCVCLLSSGVGWFGTVVLFV